MKIIEPTLVLNTMQCKANIATMVERCKKAGVELTPHFKTHQSKVIGRWFREYGVHRITVSSLKMAKYFADDGWNDITVAFPCNVHQAKEINELAERITLQVLVDNITTINMLGKMLIQNINVFVEIDTGGGRTGVPADDLAQVKILIDAINKSNHMNWFGFYSHAGQTYNAKSKEEIERLSKSSIVKFNALSASVKPIYGSHELRFGDTPSCSVIKDFGNITAVSPGNFVFYDVMQVEIGTCKLDNIVLTMHCPIVSMKQSKNELTIYGGAIHFSKEYSPASGFGRVGLWNNGKVEIVKGAKLDRISQEHGVVKLPENNKYNLSIGDIVIIYPIHSCLTAQAMGGYISEKDELIDHL